MSDDVKCPYCEKLQEINHDDGYGYEEDELHQQECSDCDKSFTYTTGIIYIYKAFKADCLNGAEHEYKQTCTFPVECTRMRCQNCAEERQPTEDEWKIIMEGKT